MLSYIRADKSFRYYYGGMLFARKALKRDAGFYTGSHRMVKGSPPVENGVGARVEKTCGLACIAEKEAEKIMCAPFVRSGM